MCVCVCVREAGGGGGEGGQKCVQECPDATHMERQPQKKNRRRVKRPEDIKPEDPQLPSRSAVMIWVMTGIHRPCYRTLALLHLVHASQENVL